VAELKEAFGSKVKTRLIAGGGGVFDVALDGTLVYSKKQTGRFPGYREIPGLIEQKIMSG
jgi:selT/selW/selH-like putative selenoprotein